MTKLTLREDARRVLGDDADELLEQLEQALSAHKSKALPAGALIKSTALNDVLSALQNAVLALAERQLAPIEQAVATLADSLNTTGAELERLSGADPLADGRWLLDSVRSNGSVYPQWH